MKKLALKKVVSFVFVCLFVFSICAVGIKIVKAEDKSRLETLLNETNTYNVVADSIDLDDESNMKSDKNPNGRYEDVQRHASYDMTQKNSNQVASDAQITVLMHGYGVGAKTWTNITEYSEDGKSTGNDFAPSKESIVYKYWRKYRNDLQIIFTTFKERPEPEKSKHNDEYNDIYDFNIYDLTEQTDSAYTSDDFKSYIYTSIKIEELFNNFNSNKHLLVLFESSITEDSNDNVYFQFNYLLSRIAKQYKDKKSVLPKYNLIGHSRGGITNLQYALDHPDMVDNLISIGTPYNGSTTALLFGEMMYGKSDALTDILDPDIYSRYKSRWNNNYELYKNINAMAIGGYSSLKFFSHVLHEDPTERIQKKFLPLVDSALVAIGTLKVLSDFSLGFLKAVAMRAVVALLRDVFPDSKIAAGVNIFVNELFYDSSLISFANDTFVNLSSQLATGFSGFARSSRKFTEHEDIDFNNVASYDTPIVHNLEPRDEKILNTVMGALTEPSSGYRYEVNEVDNTVKIIGVDKYLLKNNTGTTLKIPATINDKRVTEIGDSAFYGVFSDSDSSITSVSITSNVTKIGKDAFRDNSHLTSISVGNTNAEIGEGAFAECTSLTSITLPKNLTKISDGMFSGCGALTSITLPQTVTAIGGGAFSGCISLTSVSKIDGVTEIGNYAFYNCTNLNGVTLNSGLTTLGDFAFAYCKSMTGTIKIPDTITEINEVFVGCEGLTGITIGKNVTAISEFAFSNCKGLTSIHIPKNVASIGSGAFYGCKGITSITVDTYNSAYKVVGNCLVRTADNALVLACNNSVIPNDITAIEDFACANCDEMVSFTGKTNLKYIGVGAFSGCSKLANVDLYENLTEIKDNAFTDCTSLTEITLSKNVRKLGKEVFSGCKNLEKITLSDNLVTIEEETFANCTKLEEIVFKYKLVGIANKAFYGCENLKRVIISTGNDMVYVGNESFDNTSENLEIYVPAQSYDIYVSNKYWGAYASKLKTHNSTVAFSLNGGTMAETSASFTYGSYVANLPQPTREGMFFDGWYSSSDFNAASKVSVGTVWESIADEVTLYAKWSETLVNIGNVFEITYNNIEGINSEGYSNPLSYTQTTDTITLNNPTRGDGYRFMGWYLDENFNGSVIKQIIHGCTGDIVLYAKWAKIYTITFNSNGGEEIDSTSGIEGEVIELPAPKKEGYHGTWDRWESIGIYYNIGNFGKLYIIGDSDVTLNAIWEGNIYRINYHNAKIADTFYPTYDYKCGEVTRLQHPINTYYDIFKGYFLDCKFETPITEIPADAVGVFDVYVKWDSYACSLLRSYSVKITDSGRWKQHYDDIDVYINEKSYPEGNKYKYIKFNIELEIWEKYDGNQYLMLYDKYDSKTGVQLWSTRVTHVPYKKVTTHHMYYFQFYVEIKDEDWQTNDKGEKYYYKYFYLLYGADGKYEDDWYNANLRINTYLCVDAEDEVTTSPNVWYG